MILWEGLVGMSWRLELMILEIFFKLNCIMIRKHICLRRPALVIPILVILAFPLANLLLILLSLSGIPVSRKTDFSVSKKNCWAKKKKSTGNKGTFLGLNLRETLLSHIPWSIERIFSKVILGTQHPFSIPCMRGTGVHMWSVVITLFPITELTFNPEDRKKILSATTAFDLFTLRVRNSFILAQTENHRLDLKTRSVRESAASVEHLPFSSTLVLCLLLLWIPTHQPLSRPLLLHRKS